MKSSGASPALALYILLTAVLVIGSESALAKTVPPDAQVQQRALEAVDRIFKADVVEATNHEKKSVLAKRMIQTADDTKDDANSQFALYSRALKLAIEAADTQTVFAAVGAMDARFQIDVLSMEFDSLTAMSKNVKSADERLILFGKINTVIDACIKSERFDIAEKAGALLLSEASKSKDRSAANRSAARSREIKEAAAEFAKAKSAATVLVSAPADPAANLSVGEYECFIRGNWDPDNLAKLARGNDPALKESAARELAAAPTGEAKMAVADGWSDASKKMAGFARRAVESHSADWYRKAMPEVSGLQKLKAETRVRALSHDDSTVANPAKQRILDAGLVLHYLLNKDNVKEKDTSQFMTDLSASENTGTLHDVSFVDDPRYGSVAQFDGHSSFIDCGNGASLQLSSAFTLVAIARLKHGGGGTLISKNEWGNGDKGFELRFAGKADFLIGFPGWRDVNSNHPVDDDQWHQIAATFDGRSMWLYVDGNAAAGQNGGRAALSDLPLVVGTNTFDHGRLFTGKAAEILIFNRALSATELNELAK